MRKWEHCKLQNNRITFLGAARMFENKADAYLTERNAFSHLEDHGWMLVTVAAAPESGDFIYFFRRPVANDSDGPLPE